jgi:hypothetical protein
LGSKKKKKKKLKKILGKGVRPPANQGDKRADGLSAKKKRKKRKKEQKSKLFGERPSFVSLLAHIFFADPFSGLLSPPGFLNQ